MSLPVLSLPLVSRFRRTAIVTALAAATIGLACQTAVAATGGASFDAHGTSFAGKGSSLVVRFLETHVRPHDVRNVITRATAVVEYSCVNGGGKVPGAARMTATTAVAVHRNQKLVASRRHTIKGVAVLKAPSASAAGLSCTGGLQPTLNSVHWSAVTVANRYRGAALGLVGSHSWSAPTAKPQH